MKNKPLSVFVIALFLGSALLTGWGMQSAIAYSFQNQNVNSSADGSDYNHLPKSILVYTEYADKTTGSTGELKNTLDVVNEEFAEDYEISNLTDYTNLPSMIMDYDVLLIPEQELASSQNMTDVGTAWASSLTTFVNSGGIVIMMDFGPASNRGVTSHLYNSSNLMEINGFHVIRFTTVNVVDTSDALSRGVDSSFTAPDGSLGFETPETSTIVSNGTLPMVIHKTMGFGHVLLLGFDFFEVEDNCVKILTNAIKLTRHVVFDQSHSPYGTINGAYLNYSLDLVSEGFAVSAMLVWDPDMIETCDVLIITAGTAVYNSSETDTIEDFVTSGGGLNVFTDYGPYGEELDPIVNRFGFFRNETGTSTTGYVYDTADVLESYTTYNKTNFETHSIMQSVNEVEIDRGGVLIDMPDNAIPLITTDNDGTSFYDDDTPADGLVVAAAASVGIGRVSVVVDANFISVWTDPDSDAIQTYYDADNDQFLKNSVVWASGSGVEEQIVVFDESHGANFWLNASYYGFGQFLSSNGYTIRWMTSWDASLIDTADVLVIQDGTKNYTASQLTVIVGFVSSGGGLCLFGGEGNFGLEADLVGNEFGLDTNNTGYLLDSDDYEGDTKNIVYNASNFANHPIMNGISRLEIYYSTAFINTGFGTNLVITDSDGTSTWYGGGAANGLAVMTALEYDMGRIFYAADYYLPRYNQDPDLDGVHILYDSDNDLLLQNAFRWLTENRAPTVEVISPNGGEVLNGTIAVSWTAEDFDSDPLVFDVYYSDNNGSDWTILDSGLTGLSYDWNTTLHDDGTGYMIRVVVTDGEYTAMDESDNPFELDNFAGTGAGGFPIDSTTLLIIVAIILIIIIIVVLMRRRK